MSPKKEPKKPKLRVKKSEKVFEEYAYILDVSEDHSTAQAIGDTYLRLLEVELKIPNDAHLQIGERTYVGSDKERDLVKHIRRRIDSGQELTSDAKRIAREKTVEIIRDALYQPNSKLCSIFLLFFNRASPSSLRRIGLDRLVRNVLIKSRDQRGRFDNLSAIEQTLRIAGIRMSKFDLANVLTERINVELKLQDKSTDNKQIPDEKPLLLKFVENPMKSILEFHAEI